MPSLPSGGRLPAAALVAALLLPPPVAGQGRVVAPAWSLKAGPAVEWLRFLPAGVLVVSSEDALRGLNPADGTMIWERPDLGNVSQVAFEAAQQSASLPGGVPAASPAGPVLRLMEEMPGGRLAAILADSAGRRTWFDVIELASGRTIWSSTTLPLGEARGFLAFPDSTSILVHGVLIEPGRSRRLWGRVEAATGRLLWTSDSLLLASPAQFDASGMLASRGTINGNQPLVALPDSTVLLYAASDGLVRFEIASGRVRWRAPTAAGQPAPIGQGYAPMVLAGDTAYLPSGRSVDAIELAGGHRLWTAGRFSTITTEAAVTAGGLLVRGQPLEIAGEDPRSQRPFAALLDRHTGKPRWQRDFDRRSGLTPFLVSGDTALLGTDQGVSRIALAAGTDTTLMAGKLPGRPAMSLESRPDGILLGGAQSLTLLGPDGTPRYQREFPAPTLSLGGRLLRIALSAAAIAGGAYYSGGYLAGSAFARYQYSASRYVPAYAYFVLKDYQEQGPALAKIAKADGTVAAVVLLNGDKTPEYAVDPGSGVLVIKSGGSLTAYRW